MLNVQGLVSKNVCKLDSPEIKNIFENNDLVLFTETWPSDLYGYNGFESIILHKTAKKHGSKRASGGLIVYIRSKFYDKNLIIKTDCDDIIWLGFHPGVVSDKYVFVCLCYVLPIGTSRERLVDVSVFDRLMLHIAKFEASYASNGGFVVCLNRSVI